MIEDLGNAVGKMARNKALDPANRGPKFDQDMDMFDKDTNYKNLTKE